MHKLTGGWPCYGGVVDVLGRLISVFGAASATFGQVICQTQQSQTNKPPLSPRCPLWSCCPVGWHSITSQSLPRKYQRGKAICSTCNCKDSYQDESFTCF
eukprot:sb/3478825/